MIFCEVSFFITTSGTVVQLVPLKYVLYRSTQLVEAEDQ